MKKIQLIPLILNFGDDNFYGPWDKKFYDPGYGIGAHPQDYHKALPRYYLPEVKEEFFNHRKNWREIETRDTTPKRRQFNAKEGFQVCVDVHQFAPNEITVKTVDKDVIIVEAQHEEREDPLGYISRHFRRRYILPKEYHIKDVVAMLSSDGVLTVKAPPPPLPQEVEGTAGNGAKLNEKEVHIHHTGPAYLHVRGMNVPVIPKSTTNDSIKEDFELVEKEEREEEVVAGSSSSAN